uniref:Uncharacterized protein n=1 Tax=Rhizophora mucronata TaxID=61149 RepID=A0A2P2NDL4_RHIMU
MKAKWSFSNGENKVNLPIKKGSLHMVIGPTTWSLAIILKHGKICLYKGVDRIELSPSTVVQVRVSLE